MDFNTPVGRLVQGSVKMEHQKDMDTNQPLFEDAAKTIPMMGIFLAVAFPKVLPNGQSNAEFDQFFGVLRTAAAAAWPQLFPQGANGQCIDPRFSWKYQDGDGVNKKGQSVADKPGFKGNHIIKFSTAYPVRCFYEGKFGAHEEIQQPEQVVKRGYWVRIFGEAKGNNASGTQVPGIALYPKLLSFVERGDEILSGPDAQTALGGAAIGWRPPASANPVGMPGGPVIGMPGAAPNVAMPGANSPLMQQAMPRTLPTPPAVAMPGAPAMGMPNMMPGSGPAVGMPNAVPGAVALPMPPAGPQYVLSPALAQQGVQIDALLKQGWTLETLVQHGHATRIG